MIVPDIVFNRLVELEIKNGVFLLVSNSKLALRDEAPSFAHSLLNYTQKDVVLNERIFMTDTENISVDLVNQFIEFEAKKAVGVPAKILIMHDVELLKDNASDKLLKTLEDHHRDSLIILTSSALESVSRTVRSRSMIFKEYSEGDNYFVQWKAKYLHFITEVTDGKLSPKEIIESMQNLGSMNVVRAMFVNLDDLQWLAIARRALDCVLTGSKDEQVYTYLVYSAICKVKGIRRWDRC